MSAPRPHDPAVIMAALETHRSRCRVCIDWGTCPAAEELLMAWGDADRHYANEQRAISDATGDDSDLDCVPEGVDVRFRPSAE